MLTINSNTNKSTLIQKLAHESAKDGKLSIYVDSLPDFLDTPVAFTVFNYQLSNYPRSIVWTTESDQIFNFLSECKVDAVKPSTDSANQIEPVAAAIYDNQEKVVKSVVLTLESLETKTPTQPSENNLLTTKEDLIEPVAKPQNIESKPKPSLSPINKIPVISASDLVSHNSYTPSDLIKDKKNINKEDVSNSPEQDWDIWLQKIESTRQALNQNYTKLSQIEESSFTAPSPKYTPPQTNSKVRNRLMRTFTAAASFSLVVVLSLLAFPTRVFTFDLVKITTTEEFVLTINKSTFKKKTLPLENEDSVIPTKPEIVNLNRANGRVRLVNERGGSLQFSNGKINLIDKNNRYYRHLPVAADPNLFVIKGYSKDTYINVESSKPGPGYELKNGERLRITNLKGENIGGSFYGIVTTDISTKKETGKYLVQNEDKQKLEEKLKNNLQTKPLSETVVGESLDGFLVWPQEETLDLPIYTFEFSSKVGEVVAILKGKIKASYNFQTLSQEDIIDILMQKNSAIESVNNLEIIADPEFEDDLVRIPLSYEYVLNNDIDKNKVLEEIEGGSDSSDLENKLSTDHPYIANIKSEEKGLKLPGIPSLIDLKINENGESAD